MPADEPARRGRLLLGLLRVGKSGNEGGIGRLDGGAWDSIASFAQEHGVAPLLHERLQTSGVLATLPDSAQAILVAARRTAAFENLRHYAEFRRISVAFNRRGIPLMALKGLHLAEQVYGDISLRPMSDMDILVPESRVAQAVAAMQTLDYGPDGDLSGSVGKMLQSKCNLGFAHRRHDVYVEVHWKLSEPGSPYAAPMDEIWQSARPAQLGGGDARVMSPEFLLLYVCAHLACNHVFSLNLRALYDVAAIVGRVPGLDWQRFARHAMGHGWRRGVAVVLRLAHDNLGVAVPDRVLDALGAGALDAPLLGDALEHILSRPEFPRALVNAPNVMSLSGGGLWAKIATVWRRVFVAPAELALLYGIPERSLRLPLWYAVRLRDLLRNYVPSVWAMEIADPRIAALAARQVRLAKWVAGP